METGSGREEQTSDQSVVEISLEFSALEWTLVCGRRSCQWEATSPAAWDGGYGRWPSSWPEAYKAAVARWAAQLGDLRASRDDLCRLVAITSSPAV